MTKEETKMFEVLQKTISDMHFANQQYRNEISAQVASIKKNVEAVTEPFNLEVQVNNIVRDSISHAISTSLESYSSPIHKLVEQHVLKNSSKINLTLQEVFDGSVDVEFKDEIRKAYAHKVARAIVSNLGSSVDKVVSELKKNKLFESKLTIMVDQLVSEFRNDKV